MAVGLNVQLEGCCTAALFMFPVEVVEKIKIHIYLQMCEFPLLSPEIFTRNTEEPGKG
jgi:hypothetical protein